MNGLGGRWLDGGIVGRRVWWLPGGVGKEEGGSGGRNEG